MSNQIEIRLASADDYDALADVMFDAVRHGHSDYTEEQRRAWTPRRRSGIAWVERLDTQAIFVAENSKQVVGFMSLAATGYIDFAYIRPSAQGSGSFRRLYNSIENLTIQNREARLWVHASLMAKSAFHAMGFTVTNQELVEIGDQVLERFEMEKRLVER